jgi:hypothetical protein
VSASDVHALLAIQREALLSVRTTLHRALGEIDDDGETVVDEVLVRYALKQISTPGLDDADRALLRLRDAESNAHTWKRIADQRQDEVRRLEGYRRDDARDRFGLLDAIERVQNELRDARAVIAAYQGLVGRAA